MLSCELGSELGLSRGSGDYPALDLRVLLVERQVLGL
jgi:hypothetical protein